MTYHRFTTSKPHTSIAPRAHCDASQRYQTYGPVHSLESASTSAKVRAALSHSPASYHVAGICLLGGMFAVIGAFCIALSA